MGASVSLLIEGDYADELISYSRQLCSLQESEVRLGENGVPHLTVLKSTIECSVSPEEVTNRVGDLLNLDYALTFSGLNLMPSRSNLGVWLEVQVLRSPELVELQQTLLKRELFAMRDIECDYNENWRTHVTVARFPGPIAAPIPTPAKLLRRTAVPSRLVVGSAGNTFNVVT